MPQLDFDGANSKISADKIQGQSGTTVTIPAGHNLAGDGSGLTSLPAVNLTGTVATARLGSGTANSTTFLRGDQTYAAPAGGSTFTTVATVSTGSGTIHNIATGLPAGICQFTISMDAVEANGNTSNNFLIQLGDSGGFETAGYTSGTIRIDSGTDNFFSSTEGMLMIQNGGAEVIRSVWLFTKHGTGNIWAMNNVATSYAVTNIIASAGTKTLSGELTQIRLTTEGTSSTFAGGTVACQYTVA